MTTPMNQTPFRLHVHPVRARHASDTLCGSPTSAAVAVTVSVISFNTAFVEQVNKDNNLYTYYLCPECLRLLPLLEIAVMGL